MGAVAPALPRARARKSWYRSMSSVSEEILRAARMKRWLRSSFAVGRCMGSFVKHWATKSLKAGENDPSNAGGFAFGMRKSTRMGWYSASGGSPFAISIAVIPRLHISARASYPACRITSGAIQNGVPTKV